MNGSESWVKITRTIKDFFNSARPDTQIVLFYYSGHGIETEDEMYLATPEVDPKDPTIEGVSLSVLSRWMNNCASVNVIESGKLYHEKKGYLNSQIVVFLV